MPINAINENVQQMNFVDYQITFLFEIGFGVFRVGVGCFRATRIGRVSMLLANEAD